VDHGGQPPVAQPFHQLPVIDPALVEAHPREHFAEGARQVGHRGAPAVILVALRDARGPTQDLRGQDLHLVATRYAEPCGDHRLAGGIQLAVDLVAGLQVPL
jgi:hypothetical protein